MIALDCVKPGDPDPTGGDDPDIDPFLCPWFHPTATTIACTRMPDHPGPHIAGREETAALEHLRRLLAEDLSKVKPEELAQGVREGELLFDESQQWVGRLVAELRRRNLSWADIHRLTGLAPTTLRNRVTKHEEAGG